MRKTSTAMRKDAARNGEAPALHLEWRTAAELEDNPANWKRHPEAQNAVLDEFISEVGWAGALLYNARTGHLIDGHGRKQLYVGSDTLLPVLVGDWPPKQEKLILAMLDHTTSMADRDDDALRELLAGVDSESDVLTALLDSLVVQPQWQGEEQSLNDSNRASPEFIRPVIRVEDVQMVERALRKSGEANRGAAFLAVCRAYVGESDAEDEWASE